MGVLWVGMCLNILYTIFETFLERRHLVIIANGWCGEHPKRFGVSVVSVVHERNDVGPRMSGGAAATATTTMTMTCDGGCRLWSKRRQNPVAVAVVAAVCLPTKVTSKNQVRCVHRWWSRVVCCRCCGCSIRWMLYCWQYDTKRKRTHSDTGQEDTAPILQVRTLRESHALLRNIYHIPTEQCGVWCGVDDG